MGEKGAFVLQGCVFHVSRAVHIARFESSRIARYNATSSVGNYFPPIMRLSAEPKGNPTEGQDDAEGHEEQDKESHCLQVTFLLFKEERPLCARYSSRNATEHRLCFQWGHGHLRFWAKKDRDRTKKKSRFFSISSSKSQSGCSQKVYVWKSLCLRSVFKSRKGPSINFLGLGEGLFPGGSPASYLALEVYVVVKEGKSAIHLGNLGIFAKFGPGPFIYVRPVGGPENYLC